MRAYFKGDKNVFVFDPIPKGKRGHKKKLSHFDRVLSGTRDDLVDELEKAIKWARALSEKEWDSIVSGPGGLRGFIFEAMEK